MEWNNSPKSLLPDNPTSMNERCPAGHVCLHPEEIPREESECVERMDEGMKQTNLLVALSLGILVYFKNCIFIKSGNKSRVLE